MTHLDLLKHFVENDPWQIAHRLFDCMQCPMLGACMRLEKDIPEYETRCRTCLDRWLNSECTPPSDEERDKE